MRVLLRDLSPGQQYAVQFRSNDGAGNTSDWSQVQRFTTTNDLMPPGNVDPAGLTWYNTGTSYIAQWTPVTLNADATPIRDLRDYHVAITNGSTTIDFYTTDLTYEFSQQQCVQQFGSFQTALSVSVTARDLTYNESRVPATKAVNPLNPPDPSAPGIDTYLGLVMATWNSQTADGTDMNVACTNFNYCEVHLFTQPNQPIPPDNSSMVGRVFADNSGSKYVIPNLNYGQIYYVKLVAVNMLGKKSGPSAETQGTPGRISGLDISNGQISPSQINFTAKDIGGANAYYSNTAPTGSAQLALKTGDVWYDTTPGNHYATYRYDSTQTNPWVAAPEIGIIAGTKILAGTLTADAVGANQIITASANIGVGVIDQANIGSVNAGSIKTGNLAADGSILAGPTLDIHAEMNSSGFYVYQRSPAWTSDNPVVVPQVRMGTGFGDNFSIADLTDASATLASIDSNGGGNFQSLTSASDPVFSGVALGDQLAALSGGVVGRFNQIPSSNIGPIRAPYGICEVDADLVPGRAYRISWRATWYSETGGDECRFRVKYTTDGSSPIATSSPQVNVWFRTTPTAGRYMTESGSYLFTPSVAATHNLLLTAELGAGTGSVYILTAGSVELTVEDVGTTSDSAVGTFSSGGGTLYSAPAPTPPPAYVPKNYYWTGGANWIRSYKSGGGWMTNDGGKAFQGQDPSGYNGNQYSHIGWTTNFASMLSGASSIKVHVVLNFSHWYNNSGGTALIGRHSNGSDPGGANSSGGTYALTSSTGWPNPGTREVDITPWAVAALQNGSMRGVTLGPGSGSSYIYYGYANSASLKIWYTK